MIEYFWRSRVYWEHEVSELFIVSIRYYSWKIIDSIVTIDTAWFYNWLVKRYKAVKNKRPKCPELRSFTLLIYFTSSLLSLFQNFDSIVVPFLVLISREYDSILSHTVLLLENKLLPCVKYHKWCQWFSYLAYLIDLCHIVHNFYKVFSKL